MIDWWTVTEKMQRDAIDAQKKALAAGDAFVKLQETSRQMADANMAAFKSWMGLWGIR